MFSGKSNLTFNDGLNFGCGFFVAGAMFVVCVLPIAAGVLAIIVQVLTEVIGRL